MKQITSAIAAAVLAATFCNPAASATTSTLTLTLLPNTLSDLDAADAYLPIAPDLSQNSVGYSFAVGTGTPFQGLSGSTSIGQGPLYTPIGSGPLSRDEVSGPAHVTFATDGRQQIDISATLDDVGIAKAAISIYVPVIVNPHTSISFTTRSAIQMTFDSGGFGRAYSFTYGGLRYGTGLPVESTTPFNTFGEGSWTNDANYAFTNTTDEAITLQLSFTGYTELLLTAAPPDIPPTLPVPEPATYAMFFAGALTLLGARLRKST